MTADLLALQNVSLRLGRSPRFLLQDISFKLQPGEVTALLGKPSSGKTLLLQLINGLKSPSQGQIQWQGKVLSELEPVTRRRQISWLPQQPRLLGMTGKEAIAYPLKLQGLNNSEIQQRLEVWLDLLKLPLPWLEQKAETLSQPAAQAISLARALAIEPQLLLLDNPWPQPINAAIHHPVETSPLSESNALATWENPPEQIKLALSKFTQTGGAVLWAMTTDQIPTPETTNLARQLLCIAEGRLTVNQAATPQRWEQAIKALAQTSPTDNGASDSEAWD